MAVYIHSDIHGESSKPPPRSRSAAPPRFHPPKKKHTQMCRKVPSVSTWQKGEWLTCWRIPWDPNCWKATASSSTLSAFNARNAFSAAYAGMAFQMAGRCRCTGAQVHSRHLIKAPKSFTKKAWSFLQVIYLVKCQSHHASQSLQLLPVEVSMEHATFKNLTSSQLTRNTPKTNERMYIYIYVCTYMIYLYIYIYVCVYVCIW